MTLTARRRAEPDADIIDSAKDIGLHDMGQTHHDRVAHTLWQQDSSAAYLIEHTGRGTFTTAVIGIHRTTQGIGRKQGTSLAVKGIDTHHKILVAV